LAHRAIRRDTAKIAYGLVYLKDGDAVSLTLEKGTYGLKWYNPREGGKLLRGEVSRIQEKETGGHSLGLPPVEDGKDWVALIRKK